MNPVALRYDAAARPPPGVTLLLALQHATVASVGFITARAVAGVAGADAAQTVAFITLTALATGLATILVSLNRRALGSGYFCAAVAGPVFFVAASLAAAKGGLALVCGMTLMAGLFQVFLARALPRLRTLFPPEVVGLVALMLGFSALRFAIPLFLDHTRHAGDINPSGLLVAVLTFALMVVPVVWLPGRARLYPLLIAIPAGYLLSIPFGLLDRSHWQALCDAPWAALPPVGTFGWSFDAALILPFLVAAIASSLKAVSDLTICQLTTTPGWRRLDIAPVAGGVTGLGIGNALAGLTGGMGLSTSTGNVGLTLLTGAAARVIALVMGASLIILAFVPKAAALLLIMPAPVLGACVLLATLFMIVAGLQMLNLRPLDMRRTFVIGITLAFALSIDVMPGIYQGLPPWAAPFFDSSLAAGTVLAVALNALLSLGATRSLRVLIPAGSPPRDLLAPALSERGPAHAARVEVLDLAAASAAAVIERLRADGRAPGDIAVLLTFDEFSLDLEIVPASSTEHPDAAAVRLHIPQ